MNTFEESFPFLTVLKYLDKEYVGIIGNSDNHITSVYVMDNLPTEQLRSHFIDCCNEWWWETNRQIPINIVLKEKWAIFRPHMKTFITKDVNFISGYRPPVENPINKKPKKRQVEFIKRV